MPALTLLELQGHAEASMAKGKGAHRASLVLFGHTVWSMPYQLNAKKARLPLPACLLIQAGLPCFG